jgi:hypothetical protein
MIAQEGTFAEAGSLYLAKKDTHAATKLAQNKVQRAGKTLGQVTDFFIPQPKIPRLKSSTDHLLLEHSFSSD